MEQQRSVSLARPDIAADTLGFFRWGRVAGRTLVTNDAGDWAFLGDAELADLFGGRVDRQHARFEEFQTKGFVRDGLDLDAFAARMAKRSGHVRFGPRVHVVNLTRRPDRRGASEATRAESALDMSRETAEKIAEFALKGTAPALNFEFQGGDGEPLANFEALQQFVERARSISQHTAGKALRFRVLSNLAAMSDEIAEWMVANDVLLSTTLDGPAAVHDENRKHLGGAPHADAVRWIRHFQKSYADKQLDPRQWNVDARLAVTARTLGAPREVVDEYVALGLGVIHIRPLEAWAFDDATWAAVGYTPERYLAFRRAALDYVLELNQRGTELADSLAAILAAKILGAKDPGAVDLQSPSGAGANQLAYGADGSIYPCDEARVLGDGGDAIFEIGNVGEGDLGQLTRHPTVRTIAAASLLDAQPACADAWSKPYCGVNPVRTYLTQGDLFGQRHRCLELEEQLAVATRIFESLAAENADERAVLDRWAASESPHVLGERLGKAVP